MQQEFDFARAEQLGLLERAVLPRCPAVSANACKSTLKAIDSYGRGREAWPSVDTLAVNTGLSVRTVKRAIRALVGLSLLVVVRKGRLTLNHYRIVWSELALLDAQRSATVSQRSATVSIRSATMAQESLGSASANSRSARSQFEEKEEEEALEVVLAARLGVYSTEVTRSAIERTSAEHVRQLLDWFAERDDYGPGALCLRLRRCRVGLAVHEGWPPVKVAVLTQTGRGDGLSRPEMERESLVYRFVRHARQVGLSQSEIDRRCQEIRNG